MPRQRTAALQSRSTFAKEAGLVGIEGASVICGCCGSGEPRSCTAGDRLFAQPAGALAVREKRAAVLVAKKLLTSIREFPYRPPQLHRLGAEQANRICPFSIKRTKTVAGGTLMKVNKWTLGLAACGLVSLPTLVQAEEKLSALQTALSSTTISGYVNTSAQWDAGSGNANVPGFAYNRGKQDGFNLNVVKLTI